MEGNVRNRVYAVSIRRGDGDQTICFYRTDGTESGGGVRFYNLTTDRLIRVLPAMLNTAARVKTYVRTSEGCSFWGVLGVIEKMRVNLGQELERITLG